MAEVAAASSIAGLLSLTIQVIQISQRYISGVRNASKTIRGYFRELEIMRLVLEDLQAFVNSDDGTATTYAALETCSAELEDLRLKLHNRLDSNTSASRFNRLSWPFAEDETRRVTEVLHRYQASIHALLAAQNHRLAASTLIAIERLEARQEQHVKERIVQWLSLADPLVNHTAARDKHEPSTGDWFLNSDEFIAWKRNDVSNLWIRSIAGAGKTILSSTIVDHLVHNQRAEDYMLFYYFDFRNDKKQKLRDLLRSLIAQICVRADHVPSTIEEAFDRDAVLDMRSLAEMFTSLAMECGYVKIVIDALDESSERSLLLDFLKNLANNLTDTVQWLVTSRNEQDIGAALAECAPTIVSLGKSLVNDDIRLYIDSCLVRDPVLRSRPEWVKERISETLLSKADGMYAGLSPVYHKFQYVVCQLSVLRDCLTGPTVEAALANLPTGIDETYDRMLLSIKFENCEQVRRALLVIAFSVRPMRCEEVAEVAVIGLSKPFDIGDRLFDPKDIIGLAAGFIIYDEVTGSLMLAHYSVKEYLLSSRIMIGQARYFGLLELTAHQYITEASVSYMLSVADLTLGYHGITQDYPFLQYAAAHWVQHARHSLERDAFSGVIELASNVLDGRNGAYTFWLTYHDSSGKNRTALESLSRFLHGPQLLAIVRHPGLLYLPSDFIVSEICALFMRADISNRRSTTSAQRIINAKAEMLNIVRRLYHPSSNFYRLKMFRKVCLMDAGKDASPNWEPLNEAMYLALFEPLDFTGTGNPPETIPFEQVELEGEKLQPDTAAIEAREPHEHHFSHVLEYIRRRISEASVEGDVRDVIEPDEGPLNAQLDSQSTATIASDGSWQMVWQEGRPDTYNGSWQMVWQEDVQTHTTFDAG